MHAIETPVVMFIFNRPRHTEAVFDQIRKVQPKHLLIIADGPRTKLDKSPCWESRQIVRSIDWECCVETEFAQHNLGCRSRLASGLDWVFSRVDRAIILEDDCVPDPSFFRFAADMLSLYEHDPSVMMVGGSQPLGVYESAFSYEFSKYALIWGWATWRRAWKHYDVNMPEWGSYRFSTDFTSIHPNDSERSYWDDCLERTFLGHNTWDYQWSYTLWKCGGLAILPTNNLIRNIGFGTEATHTKDASLSPRYSVKAVGLEWPIRHPLVKDSNKAMDEKIYEKIFALP